MGNTQVTKERTMKKIIAAAAGLMMFGTLASSASAVESQFGGYWRTRMFTEIDFDGKDSGSTALTDTRTRLYYTAKFNENFSFVNKFEFNNVWGDNVGGDLGADGTGIFRIKNSYADFTTGMARFKVGIQGATLARGFLFADDFSGVYAGVNAGDMALLQFMWIKVDEKEVGATTTSSTTVDFPVVDADLDGAADTTTTTTVTRQEEIDVYAFVPVLTLSDAVTVTPYFAYANVEGNVGTSDADMWWLGADVDFTTDAFSIWGTGIYAGGENTAAEDIQGYLLAAGGNVGMFHAQAFYASGDDTAGDGDQDAYLGIAGNVAFKGQSYYWAEIMGFGIFDNDASAGRGALADKISNIMAVNAGVTAKVSEKLTLNGDVWYAQLAEDVNGEDELGVEVDFVATYAIMDNLKLDLVAAYLFAGDATSTDGNNEEDPIEIGARLSLSF
jgi:hypothetical protein